MRGSIVKRKSKTGTALYYVVVPVEGRQKWLTVPGPQTKKNAEAYRAQIVAEISRGEFFELPQITLAEFAEIWLETLRPELSINSIIKYEKVLRLHIAPKFGRRQLSKISRENIERWKGELLAEYSGNYVSAILVQTKQIFKQAIEWNYIIKNPAAPVKVPKKPKTEQSVLTPEQIRRLLEAADSVQWRAFLLTAVTTGLRIGELVAMKWKNVDWEQGKYAVMETYQYHGESPGFKRPKSAKSAGVVELSPACLELLKTHRKEQVRHRLQTPGYVDLDLLFPRKKGTIFLPPNIWTDIWQPLLKKAGVPKLRLHDLRHTCAALLIDQGESPKFIQQQMRHATIQTTFDTYGHLFPEHGQEALGRLDSALFGAAH